MEAVDLGKSRDFECPSCGKVNVHACNPGARMSIWCPACRAVTDYHVRDDGVVEVIGEE